MRHRTIAGADARRRSGQRCFDIPICWSIRSVFDTLDGIDTMTDDFQNLLPDMERLDTLMSHMIALVPSMIDTLKNQKLIALTTYQSQKSEQDQEQALQSDGSGNGSRVRCVQE
jgi:RND superfamily putative drug exporter